jgi:hypothetical protein
LTIEGPELKPILEESETGCDVAIYKPDASLAE